ncbi:lipid IV(A) 3-deoxy-D-manno-octulosonic acid transferase [Pseudomonas sp. F1_0610]|uniref:lipid IV(A) 3-deoxy-D-manno-octulosonic acid transferase n=1 Tax=Pseudomonas sp. F1_0610 TaxID=3114284 RepID=UPI0039C3CB05
MNRFWYSLFFYVCTPLLLLRLWRRSKQAPAYKKRIAERFARQLPAFKKGGVWLHAVSVGESIAAAPVVKALQASYPNLPITITCMTPTGSERIQAMFGDSVQHCYLPYDLPSCAKRFLQAVQPKLAIVMETELWPNHIHHCYKMQIPVVLANARLSARSAKGYAKFPKLVKPMLQHLSLIAVQTQTEAERFLALGATEAQVQVTGSIKFDLSIAPEILSRAQQLRESWQAQQRLVWIAGSTHQGEDEQLLAAHQQLLTDRPDALLILVPRHPERFDAVFALCQAQKMATQRRSTQALVDNTHQVLLGDTMGEMLLLYACADMAFVGGSLVEHGGHNLLEPAALGKPVLSGKHIFNFLDIAEQLLEAGDLLQVEDSQQLAQVLLMLAENPAKAQHMREAGFSVLHNNQGALQRLMDAVAQVKSF